ncbi:RagB/SusD family nutrient uptake outer membrane protein [Spirosoma taeanense]|uniref:RagB/SusD family nutrient uptake outer membrane protein n=1 Tax=Spirosoma taeanense TaxID=2735870 RepID=A0A6M5YC45_9BACT|nr:RagB/SusD family nutrient uptake outer membrane protein [Spirosoma taeanense]QJW91549.1 RagB/SusD family nutrient uptake outer membrane protein [Spirosoma taeanense]
MKRYIKTTVLSFALVSLLGACKEQLDVKNPNQPTPGSAATETGVIALGQGGIYVSGFKEVKYYDGVPGRFWTGAVGFHELMGDVIGEEAANVYGNQIGMPDYVILDDGTRVVNPSAINTQMALLRTVNVNANAGANPLYYEWAYMYNINNAMNSVLAIAEATSFSGDAAAQTTKKNTIKAWAYWWKGYAYSRIGSMYYAGIINNETGVTNGNYIAKEKIIEEATKNLDQAATLLSGLTNDATYLGVMKGLIPDFNQVGKGVPPTPEMWKRSINTLKARNILVNTPAKSMTAAQWGQILTLTNDGVKATDYVFTGRSNDNGDFFARTDGNIAAKATGAPGSVTYKVSERLIQDFPAGDKRLDNNFTKLASAALFNSDRGNSFNTRWQLVSGGKGLAGVAVLSNQAVGAYELYLAGTYEENELMKAEAKIYTGDIAGGLAAIDAVRTYQGAGLAPLSGLSLDAAKEELRKERRVGLAFRGLSFYDARRWGVITDGRKGAVVVDKAGKVNTNATIAYNFLDYWDVPDNELAYNPAAAGSAPTKNPK